MQVFIDEFKVFIDDNEDSIDDKYINWIIYHLLNSI